MARYRRPISYTRTNYLGQPVTYTGLSGQSLRISMARQGGLQGLYGPDYVKKGSAIGRALLGGVQIGAGVALGAVTGGAAAPLVGAAASQLGGNVAFGYGITSGGIGQGGPQIQPPGGGIDVGPVGIGVCPPGTRCLGFSPLGACIGGCVPDTGAAVGGGGFTELPVGHGGAPYGPGIAQGVDGNGRAVIPCGAGGACPSGMHPNRSDYFLKSGQFVPAGSRCVPNRRRNPLNPRAASRAGRRLRAAAKAAKWLNKVDVPKRMR